MPKHNIKNFLLKQQTPSDFLLIYGFYVIYPKTILIFAEQGIGDLIQFSRYLFVLRDEYNCKVILRLKQNLSHFFEDKDKRIKITAHIRTSELRSDGIKVKVHVQKLINNIWSDTVTDNNLASKIENNILNEARNLRVNANK